MSQHYYENSSEQAGPLEGSQGRAPHTLRTALEGSSAVHQSPGQCGATAKAGGGWARPERPCASCSAVRSERREGAGRGCRHVHCTSHGGASQDEAGSEREVVVRRLHYSLLTGGLQAGRAKHNTTATGAEAHTALPARRAPLQAT